MTEQRLAPVQQPAPHDDPAPGVVELPRVLFISVNPFSETSNNGKTFASFFRGYPIDRLAQLYFHREVPSSGVCQNYYHVTDEDLIRGVLRPWAIEGAPVDVTAPASGPLIPEAPHTALRRSRAARLARQALWSLIRFDGPRIAAWLDDFRPQVIFFCGGDAAALYAKVDGLARRYDAAVVYYITDDYVLPLRTRNLAAAVSRRWTRSAFLRMAQRADLVLTVGERMSQRYKESFGIDSTPIMNIVDVPAHLPARSHRHASPEDPLRFVYAGSYHSNRWRVLIELKASLGRLRQRGVHAELHVYGPEPTSEVADALHNPPLAHYGGLLDADHLPAALAAADVLVHVEADDPESVAVTALSVSTKIPEYLASGSPVLALGPADLASIEYLETHHAAAVVQPGDSAHLDDVVLHLVQSVQLRACLAERGHELARRHHDGDQVRAQLWRNLRALT